MSRNGKGDDRRPTQVDYDTFAKNWDRIFTKKAPAKTKAPGNSRSRREREPK